MGNHDKPHLELVLSLPLALGLGTMRPVLLAALVWWGHDRATNLAQLQDISHGYPETVTHLTCPVMSIWLAGAGHSSEFTPAPSHLSRVCTHERGFTCYSPGEARVLPPPGGRDCIREPDGIPSDRCTPDKCHIERG